MPKTIVTDLKEQRRQLVQQVASSPYFAKSARLREMFIYVCDRVLDHEVAEIHEQEVGRRVFGRPPDYDTAADNTVRVHASILRKRVDQYFANEGSNEPVVIEIPRGNYAPVFHPRPPASPKADEPVPGREAAPPEPIPISPEPNWRRWLPAGVAAGLLLIIGALLLQAHRPEVPKPFVSAPTVQQFWSQLFQPGRSVDLVLGDAALALFEERTGRTVALSEYFDRSYFNAVSEGTTGGKLDPELGKVLLLKRQSNYSDVALLAQLTEIAHQEQSETKVRFARDYSFREIKADNAVLLGNVNSNPWVEPFQNHQTLHWKFDAGRGSYFPIDSTAAAADHEKYRLTGQPVEGYAIVSLFPNLGGTGDVLIVSGTGGSAMGGALGFLTDEHLMSELRAQLHVEGKAKFPYFEALLQIGSRSTLPRDSKILIARPLHQ
jgi:hypothetical protein